MSKNIAAIGFVYVIATLGWVFLGSTIVSRTESQDSKLKQEVGQLWGTPLSQSAPGSQLKVERLVEAEEWDENRKKKRIVRTTVVDELDVPLTQSDIRVDLNLDQRQKGLLWYSTYGVTFSGDYVFENIHDKKGVLEVSFEFPAKDGRYDDFRFEVDGSPAHLTQEKSSLLIARIPSQPRSRHTLKVNYKSQGLDRFIYQFGNGISEVRNFNMAAATDFSAIDFPGNTISPSAKNREGNGWELTWQYTNMISGNGIGIEMPQKLNPGPLASRISFFAPVSLAFFFFLIFIIALLRGISIHPMNYFFLASSFFAFHLLLAYLVDHVSIHLAFAICSAVSIFLAVSYMRIVVGNRFAFMEVAFAQVIYLVGFSYAFFIEGFTGLAVTAGAIVTLFVVMQMTARINWSERFGNREGVEAIKPLTPKPAGILNSVHPSPATAGDIRPDGA
ncbi:MAG TPA: inner membrane CreD family protein [Blastocatellia bacterium]|nr:inner membrane CreD family protein [Blastocatellia bacterium]